MPDWRAALRDGRRRCRWRWRRHALALKRVPGTIRGMRSGLLTYFGPASQDLALLEASGQSLITGTLGLRWRAISCHHRAAGIEIGVKVVASNGPNRPAKHSWAVVP